MATRPPSSHGKLPRKCTFYAAFFLYPLAQGGDKCGATNTPLYICGLCRPLVSLTIDMLSPALRFRCKLCATSHARAHRKSLRGKEFVVCRMKGAKIRTNRIEFVQLNVTRRRKILVRYIYRGIIEISYFFHNFFR